MRPSDPMGCSDLMAPCDPGDPHVPGALAGDIVGCGEPLG